MSVKLTTDTQTNWTKLARQDDSEIDYSDAPAMPFELPNLRIRQVDGSIINIDDSIITIDTDILAWFKAHYVNYQDNINQLLRDYINHELAK